jgi:rfaE bifunctional protein nucleotidyltransferase chain/domain
MFKMKNLDYIKNKFYDNITIIEQLNIWRSENKKIVFTNGCFDILHKGHVEYLSKSKDFGDILIVGLNSDSSVNRLKGETRPINNQNSRAFILSALLFVDAVIYFDEDTPLNLIENIKPDVLVKGGDYKKEDIVGYDFVVEIGGEVKTIDFVKGYSTTNIINKSKNHNIL